MNPEGGAGGMGKFGSQMQGGGTEEDDDSTPLYIITIVEVEPSQIHRNKQTDRVDIRHKYGHTYLPHPSPTVEWKIISRVATVAKKFDAEKSKIKDDDVNKADKLLALAQWALEHGLIDKVPAIMADLAKVEPKHQGVVAFQKVQAEMERPLTKPNEAVPFWKEKLTNFETKTSEQGHYVMLYEGKSTKEAESHLKRLEANYRGFYYWFALRGRTLHVPDRPLLTILVKNQETFDHTHNDIFDGVPMVSDGFFARRDNLAVFAAQPQDENYKILDKAMPELWGVWTQDELLEGQGKLSRQAARKQIKFDGQAWAQTVGLIYRATQDESELATVSHEGTRQLIAAMNLLPRNVEIPQWIDFGLASFFETPKGSFWAGTGSTSMRYMVNFKNWDKSKSKKLERNPVEALKATVSDRYFHEVKDGKTKEPDLNRARTMAWALTYFLSQQKRDGLLRYLEELSTLPRDMKFDEEVLLGAFARAFGLVDVNKPTELDTAKLGALANSWYAFIRTTPLESEQVIEEYNNAVAKKKPQTQLRTTNPPSNRGGDGGIP
jgi:hypothetical protein